uniref:Uncharacterized protein n=1 Tax=Rhizophora mucronata TaxID=61149 RepID=A0A2P2NKZ3_RHIMU
MSPLSVVFNCCFATIMLKMHFQI